MNYKLRIANYFQILAASLVVFGFVMIWPPRAPAQTQTGAEVPVRVGPASKTYRTSFSVVCGGAGDCVTIYGAANSKIRVREVWAVQPSANTNVSFITRSTADSGGASTSQAPLAGTDLSDAAPSATVLAYTAAPTAGTLAATVAGPVALTSSTSLIATFGVNSDKPITLNSSSQGLAVNVSAAATLTVTIEWTE